MSTFGSFDSLKLARKNVQRGVKLLNKKRPGWLKEVKSTKLDLASCRLCVLGQIYSDESLGRDGFEAGLRILNGDVQRNPGAYGFDLDWDGDGDGCYVPSYGELAKIWKEEIAAQRRLQKARAAR